MVISRFIINHFQHNWLIFPRTVNRLENEGAIELTTFDPFVSVVAYT